MKYSAVISFTDFDFTPLRAAFPSSFAEDDLLLGIVPGRLSPQGHLYHSPRVKGCDIVLTLPSVCVLSDFTTAAFSAVSLLRSLHLIDRILVPVNPMNIDFEEAVQILIRTGYFLFTWPRPFQQALKDHLASDPSSYIKAQSAVIEPFIPKAGKLLSDPANALAAEVLKVEKQLYCLIPVEFVPSAAFSPSLVTALNLYPLLAPFFALPRQDFDRRLENTAGGYGSLIRFIQDAYLKKDLDKLCLQAETNEEVRLFLLRFAAGISRGNSFICGLSTWTPYAKAAALTEKGQKQLPQIRKASWTPLLEKKGSGWDGINLLDDSVKMILEKDDYSSFHL